MTIDRERFWFSVGLVLVPVVSILLMMLPRAGAMYGARVEGHVHIHGHPMAGGYIALVPDDMRLRTAVASIDEAGYYRFAAVRVLGESGGTSRFRICLLPKHHDPSSIANHASEKDRSQPENARTTAEARNPDDADLPSRLTDPRTTDLAVRLGREPARVEIGL